MKIFRDNIVDIQNYYYHGEIDKLKLYVLDNTKFLLERKLSNINTTLSRLKRTR